MKFFTALLLTCLFSYTVSAQNKYLVKGYVVDTAYTVKLVNSAVSVLNAKDSTLVSFARVKNDAVFQIGSLKPGNFILMVTYPGYADYVERFTLDSVKQEKDFGKVNLLLKARLLQDVIIKGTAAAIKIKGDTTEFNAGSFTIQPNSKVEDLLKQLPGIQVDQDGKITAQGQTVNKVLVDGEEFFGDDPTLVTKNIRGDMVDKVQLYDKKSDQATFTGIDDGEKTKTINIKLKEDKKQGYFGKIDAGVGTNDNYNTQAMVNIFKGKRKFSAYGTLGNTGTTGLGWRESSQYGASSNMEFSDDGMIFISGGSDELESFGGSYNGRGIPVARTGGVHYDGKWNADKESINTNYKIGSLGVTGSSNTLSQNNLPNGVIRDNSDEVFDNFAFRQKLDAMYELKLDSTSNLKVSVDGTLRNSENKSTYNGEGYRNNNLLNTSDREVNNETDQQDFKASAFWNKKMKKKGRSISLNVSETLSQSDTRGFLYSDNGYYSSEGILDSSRVIDQYKTSDVKSNAFSSNLTYSEPFSPFFSVILNYGFGMNNTEQDRRSYNAASPGEYSILDTVFSNHYKFDQMSNQVGAVFNFKNDKTTINFGSKVTAVEYDQLDVYTSNRLKRDFINWNPQASYQYKFNQQKSFRFNYNGNTNQPGINQIQPVRVNTDPLNETIGNPNLKPSFTNRMSAGYSSYKVLSSRSIWLNASYSFTMNPIVNNTVTDSAGKTTYQSFNLAGKNTSNFYGYANYSKKLQPLDIYIDLNGNISGSNYFSYVNNELNSTKSYSYSAGIGLSKYKEKKYNFRVSWDPSYNTSESSLQKALNNNGWGYRASGSGTLYLPWKMELNTDGNYEYTAATASFGEDFKRFIWNASFAKKFMKSEQLRLAISGKDLLNQNTGFDRNAYENRITQTTNTTIRRYFMLSLVWDFNKMGGAAPQN